MIKILIADDHPIVRQGLKQIISETADMVVKDEASNSQEVIEKIQKSKFDILILDISMPGRSGLDILKDIKTERPDLPVLILTMHPEDQLAARVLKAGASGYLTKDSAAEQLVSAVRKIVAGGKYLNPELAERIAFMIGNKSKEYPHEILSDREFHVMCLIGKGKSIREISEELMISPKTVSTYRTRILEKMNFRNDADIIHYTIENKII